MAQILNIQYMRKWKPGTCGFPVLADAGNGFQLSTAISRTTKSTGYSLAVPVGFFYACG